MAGLIRCKACGLIISSGFPGDVCPACGVPRSSFEPYTDRMSPGRRRWLKHHIHSLTVHFPQAFTVFLLMLIFSSMGSRYYHPVIGDHITATARTLAVILPLSVLTGFATGVFDGKIRFKHLNPPFLRLKMVIGSVFFMVTSLMTYMIMAYGFDTPAVYLILMLNAIGFVCSIILGKIGGMIHCAELGGK